MHRCIRCRSSDEQGARLIPRHMGRTRNQVVGVNDDELGLARPIVRESDDFVANRDPGDPGPDFLHDAREVSSPRPRGTSPATAWRTLPRESKPHQD